MTEQSLFDTCTISQYFKAQAQIRTPKLVARVAEALAGQPAYVSVVSQFELDRLHYRQELEGSAGARTRLMQAFLSRAVIVDMTTSTWTTAAEIHARAAIDGVVISDADLLILATAHVHRFRLMTTDLKFARNAIAIGYADNIEAWELV